MVLRFFLFAGVFLFVSCADTEFNNPYDPESPKYRLSCSSSVEPSSSSVAVYSSSLMQSSSSSILPSSSSVAQSSSSVVVSSSSSIPSSSSSEPPSSSSVAKSSSSAVVSSSSSMPSSSSSLTYMLTCTSVPATGTAGTAINRPTVACDGTTINDITWIGAPNWSTPVEGTYNISVSATNGSCNGKTASCGTLIVSEPGKGNNIANYKTKQIGEQVWMAENLDYYVSGSKCYNASEANCAIYGRLYSWATAMSLPDSCNSSICSGQIKTKHQGICPSGWHIPSNAEWSALETAVGGSSTAGTKLKAKSGWNGSGNGTDDFGFSALPGGGSYSFSGSFSNVGDHGFWWSSTENDHYTKIYAYSRSMSYNRGDVDYNHGSYRSYSFSVRCLQDQD